MDSSGPAQLDIFDMYSQFCAIKDENDYVSARNVHTQDDDLQRAKFCRDALAELLRMIHSRLPMRNSIFDELSKLMSRLNLSVMDFPEFSRLYDFVFFICRENGQKNITVSKAVTAWRLVLTGRFRLLNQWCNFVERNQRYNISEDTWQQVLAFSRCVHENLEGYDPEGAWPVLMDDFVEHMYRISGSRCNTNFSCTCDDWESHDDSLPGLKSIPGLKRRLNDALRINDEEPSNASDCNSLGQDPFVTSKRRRLRAHGFSGLDESIHDDCMEIVRHGTSPISSLKSQCSVERCLSKGIAGLFSNHSYMPFDQESRVPSM